MNIGRQAIGLVNPLTVSRSATDALKKAGYENQILYA